MTSTRELLMLAQNYKGQHVDGWLMSIKLDGMRTIWVPETRGVDSTLISWANNDKSTGLATGLWSRGGKIIYAPKWFTSELPTDHVLDGELYAGREMYQYTMSVCKRHVPDSRWKDMTYNVFDVPDGSFYAEGGLKRWEGYFPETSGRERPFAENLTVLNSLDLPDHVKPLEQVELPTGFATDAIIKKALFDESAKGGEGLMIRDPNSYWRPKRVNSLLKVKKLNDDKGVVLGFTAGRETDKGSKLLGKIGAVIVGYKGQQFKLSGFTEEEREFAEDDSVAWAMENPEAVMPEGTQGVEFKVGDVIEFKYMELYDSGLPKIARYWRKA